MSRKENVSGNTDEKEKARKLSKDEQKRLEQFETLAENMREKGYRRTDLTISIVKANFFAIGLLVPAAVIGFGIGYFIDKKYYQEPDEPYESESAAEADDEDDAADADEEEKSAALESESIEE